DLGNKRMLFLGLLLAADLLGAAVPEWILHQVHREPGVKMLAGLVSEQLFRHPATPFPVWDQCRYYFTLREHLWDKVRLVTMPTSADWIFLPLPPALSFLYYFLRPVRLAGKYGRRLFRRSW